MAPRPQTHSQSHADLTWEMDAHMRYLLAITHAHNCSHIHVRRASRKQPRALADLRPGLRVTSEQVSGLGEPLDFALNNHGQGKSTRVFLFKFSPLPANHVCYFTLAE